MAASSSTSSSDASAAPVARHGPRPHAPLGFPWALLIALLIVAGVEVYLHSMDPMKLIAYASDEGQYHAVRGTVAVQGPAEVALVGSSQMREGVSMPSLLAEAEKKLRRPVKVANYAVRGARLDAMNAEVRYLLKQPNPPKLIVVGVSQRDLRADDVDWPRVALFWNFKDWRAAGREWGYQTDVLPIVIRNQAGQALDTLKYREEISLTLARLFTPFGVVAKEEGNPILGEITDQHQGSRGQRNLTSTKVPMRKLMDRAADSYMFDQPAKPRKAMAASLKDLIAAFKGSSTRCLIVQMPDAPALSMKLAETGQTKAFEATLTQAAQAGGVEYLPDFAGPLQLNNDHFSDLQHLNLPGAERFGIALANAIAERLSNR